MADRWMDERDRRWRERDWRRSEEADRRFSGGEGRSFEEGGRDRVFGERESGVGYGGPDDRPRYGVGEGWRESYGGRAGEHHGRNWQGRRYGGVSPAMEQDEYDLERRAERYQERRGHDPERGGRYYGDAGHERIYREEYGLGGVEYGDVPRGYDAGGRNYDRDRFEARRGFSGGTGGYDYERGYGDGGRSAYGRAGYGRSGWGARRDYDRGEDRGQRFEQAGREAGEFFRRAGERVASWFGGERDDYRNRDFRGMGPKGYRRADERISDEVHERLTDDPWVDASQISISVSAGEVTLSGTVENREAKHRAERCVEDISGVTHVQNNLRVDRGSFLTSASRGYGDSVLEAQMRGEAGSGDGGGAASGGRTPGVDAGKAR